MILSRATGSYSLVIPAADDPSNSTSVVYTISSTDPPRSVLDYNQIPTGIAVKQRSNRTASDVLRRRNYGDLVATIKENRPRRIETGNQLFYVGQMFDFEDVPVTNIDGINTSLETTHDQHYVDPDTIGLEQSDLAAIELNATSAQQQVLLELEGLQKRKDDLEVEIVNQQRIINESNRVIDALDVILAKDPDNSAMTEYLAQVQEAKAEAQVVLNDAVEELGTLPVAVRQKHDELRALAPVID